MAEKNPEALAQLISGEFCKVFKNIFITEQLRTTASLKISTGLWALPCL